MPGSYFKITNNADTVLQTAIDDSITSVVVSSVSELPTTFPYLLTIWDSVSYADPSDDPDMELLFVSGAVGTTLTVTRGYSTTVGAAHAQYSRIALLVVKEILDDSTYGIQKNIDDALIPSETLTTEGDILVRGATDLERLPIGTVGQIIVPDGLGNLFYISPHVSTGFIETPTITDNGDGTIDIPAKIVSMADNAIFEGTFLEYTLPAQTGVSLTNNSRNYIVGDYNGGSPIYKVITDVDLINTSDIIPYITLYRIDNEITELSWGEMGDGLSNKTILRIIKTERFIRESGLTLAEDTGRVITISSGKTWNGINRLSLQAARSDTHQTYQWYHVSGVWTRSAVTQYNNTYYDDGTDLVAANPNKFIVNWIYRVEEEPPSLAILLGGAEYTSAEGAKNEQVPSSIPDKLIQAGILIGRIIVEQNASSASTIESAFVQQFTPSGISDHGGLSGLLDDDHTQYLTDARGDLRYLYIANTTPYTPTADYHPSTKKYADDILGTHEADTSTHGVGTIVGKDEAQILTNKAINADDNTIINIDNDEIKISAGIVESKLTLDYSTASLKSSITAIEDDIDYPTTVKQKDITDTGEDGGIEGGVFNGNFEYGTGTVTDDGWIGAEKYGWYADRNATAISVSYDNGKLKLSNSDGTGSSSVRNVSSVTLPELSKHATPMIASAKYRLSCKIKTDNAATDAVFLSLDQYDSNAVVGTTVTLSKVTGDTGETYYQSVFTSDADAAYAVFESHNDVAGNISSAWFDDIKLEQIDTQAVNTQVVTPVSVSVEGVTTTDNIDQYLETSGQTYTLGTAIDEGATHRQTFTPTADRGDGKHILTKVQVLVAAIGTGDWTLTIHDASNAVIASQKIVNGSMSTGDVDFDTPAILDVGTAYHFHITSTVADGTVTTTTLNDLETADYHAQFSKHTESPSIEANGGKLDLTGVKLLTGATITVNADGSGKYVWKNNVTDFGRSLIADLESTSSNNFQQLFSPLLNGLDDNELIWKLDFGYPANIINFSTLMREGNVTSGDIYYSTDGVTYRLLHTGDTTSAFFDNALSFNIDANGSPEVYLKFDMNFISSAWVIHEVNVIADLDCSAQLPLMVPSSEVQSETSDLVLNPIDISEGQYWELSNDLTGWPSRTITMLADEATWEAQAVSANTVYVYDSNGTTPWTWDTRNGLVPPADRTSGAVMAKFLVGDNQIKSSVNDGSMKANFNLSWDEESLRSALNRLTEKVNVLEDIAESHYAEMYLNNNSNASVLETASIPVALRQFTTGDLSKWTFEAGSTGAITAYADYSGTVAGTVLATSATHGLSTGDIISIRGTTNYNGVFQITVVDASSFYFTDTWVADDGASDWDAGSYLEADAGSDGEYEINWNLSTSEGGAAGSTVTFVVYKNATPQPKATTPRKYPNNDVGSASGGCKISIEVGDRIFITASSTGTNDITNSYGNFRITKN